MLICKNRRRPFLRIPKPIWLSKNKRFTIIKDFLFTCSTIYKFDDEDQHDINKLFGFSVGMHHTNSFRFGWRPTADLSGIEIVGYEYRDGVRVPAITICDIQLEKWYGFAICYDPEFSTIDYIVCERFGNYECTGAESSVDFEFDKHWGYTLGLYFGGNKKAPHDITINERVVD
jgi:hypothetical protein